ncbi:hypothetical protein, partial [Salmonella enterica]|uniref:hypothetical protein n=1 Tax=Salmonella enterica TaxID=28901 RepID=UPI003296C5CA
EEDTEGNEGLEVGTEGMVLVANEGLVVATEDTVVVASAVTVDLEEVIKEAAPMAAVVQITEEAAKGAASFITSSTRFRSSLRTS